MRSLIPFFRGRQQPQPTPIPASAQPVPDAEALRRAALLASWERDRKVARRRRIWRWFLWAFPRWLLPAMALLAAAWFAVPLLEERLREPATAAAPAPAPPVNDSTVPDAQDAAPSLRLQREWRVGTPPAQVSSGAVTAPAVGAPSLSPDQWLHSKEP